MEDNEVYNQKIDDYVSITNEYLHPRLIIPALNIFSTETLSLSDKVQNAIDEVFFIYWADTSSCANKIRNVVELILDEFKVAKTQILKNNKKRQLRLHERIEIFKVNQPKSAESLMAIKWIGNFGSHSSKQLSNDDLLDGLEILEHVVHKLFEKETRRIKQLSKKINKIKGPIRTKE